MAEPRPRWANAVREFLSDEILTGDYCFPSDGSDDATLGLIEEAVNAVLCNTYGHEVVNDQCTIPSHRYCVYCGRLIGTISIREGFDTVEPEVTRG